MGLLDADGFPGLLLPELGELAIELGVELAGGVVGYIEEADDAGFLPGQAAERHRQQQCGGEAQANALEARPIHSNKMEIESLVRQVGF